MRLNWVGEDDALRANVYTTTEPFLRKHLLISATSAKLVREAQDRAEERARLDGYVPLSECPVEVQEHWARADAEWLVLDLLRYLESRAP